MLQIDGCDTVFNDRERQQRSLIKIGGGVCLRVAAEGGREEHARGRRRYAPAARGTFGPSLDAATEGSREAGKV